MNNRATEQASKDFLNYLAVERGASPRTTESYQTALSRIVPFCPTIDDLTKQAVRRLLQSLQERGLAPSTCAHQVAVLKSFTRFLVCDELIDADPLASMSVPKAPQKLPRALGVEEFVRLVALTNSTARGVRDRAILWVLFAAGLRVAELVSLPLTEVVLGEKPYVRVVGKGNKERAVPIIKEAAEAVEAYLKVRGRLNPNASDSPDLFITKHGTRFSRNGLRLLVRRYGERIGIDGLHPHQLRHGFATTLLEGGADILVISNLMGHVSVNTTQRYMQVNNKFLRESYESAWENLAARKRGLG